MAKRNLTGEIHSECACKPTNEVVSDCLGVSCEDKCPPTYRVVYCGSRTFKFDFGKCGFCMESCCDMFFKKDSPIEVEVAPRGDCPVSGKKPNIRNVRFNADNGCLYFQVVAHDGLNVGERFLFRAWGLLPNKDRVPLKQYVVIEPC